MLYYESEIWMKTETNSGNVLVDLNATISLAITDTYLQREPQYLYVKIYCGKSATIMKGFATSPFYKRVSVSQWNNTNLSG